MADWSQFQDFKERLAKGEFNFQTDTLKLALSNVAPNLATMSTLADVTQIAAGNGYVAGGYTLAGVTLVEAAGVATVDASDLTIAAAGGAIATFRYVYLYDDTATGDPLIQVSDLGAAIDLSDGDSRTLTWSANGLLQIGA